MAPSEREIEHRGSFIATGEQSGEVEIHVFATVIVSRTFSGVSRSDGLKELRTSDGEAINRVDKGHYRTLDGEDLYSDSPEAP